MKKIIAVLSVFLISFSANAKDDFFFKPAVTIEYSAPEISGGGVNTSFKNSQNLFDQIWDFENLALGANLRVHKYLGFNANWAQTAMDNYSVFNVGALSQKANFRLDQYNFSALGYLPIVEDTFEIFAEAGVSNINSKLTYVTSGNSVFSGKAHETKGFYGAGLQINLTKSDALRISFQKYCGKLALLDANFSTVRIGYLKAF